MTISTNHKRIGGFSITKLYTFKKMNLTLVIMAAGMGSRYGGVKQLEGIGPSGETLMDYSIHDAIKAGFNKVVFIIRKDLQEAFDNHYAKRFQNKIEIKYVYQDTFKPYEENYTIDRSKPWGTGHAMLSTREVVKEPFAILNADDYYGRSAFEALANQLSDNTSQNKVFLLGYKLINTLSDHGTVSRGLCQVNNENLLVDVEELTDIGKREDQIYYDKEGKSYKLKDEDLVSMNFWGFMPSIYDDLDAAFNDFLRNNYNSPKAEFYIPSFVDLMLKDKKIEVKVIPTDESWLGVTYKEDKPLVIDGIKQLVQQGLYPAKIE